MNWDTLQYNDQGLIPVIVQDVLSGEILMMAWSNRESLEKTLETGEMVFFSRSRQEIWHKGATSGNRLLVKEIRMDCDGDTLLALVEPLGPACHTGAVSCFYRNFWGKARGKSWFLGTLWRALQKRRNASPEESYTAKLLARGPSRVGQKIGEEGVETALAVALQDKEALRYEAADLLYHLLVGLMASEVSLDEVLEELESRHNVKARD
jgi:phosphoribosyl-ATP pyrophosphohydrolase/phosphoribosyl-AMP cyclohydrolase